MDVNQPEFRLLRQHVVQGSTRRWTCAVVPGGWELLVGGAQGSSKLFHLLSASPEPSMASHMLCLTRSSCSMTPKVKSVEGCSSVGDTVWLIFLVNAMSASCCTLASSWETAFWSVWAFFLDGYLIWISKQWKKAQSAQTSDSPNIPNCKTSLSWLLMKM